MEKRLRKKQSEWKKSHESGKEVKIRREKEPKEERDKEMKTEGKTEVMHGSDEEAVKL